MREDKDIFLVSSKVPCVVLVSREELLLVVEVLLVTPRVEPACESSAGTFMQIAMRGLIVLLEELRR